MWKTKRDKERMHARYEIRERIAVSKKEEEIEKSSPLLRHPSASVEGISRSGKDVEHNAISCATTSSATTNTAIIRSYFSSIEKRDIAAFGIAKLVKNLSKPNNLLDCWHSVKHLNLQKAYCMCVSRFGVEFGASVLNYWKYNEANNIGISLIAYAAMLGEYQIVCSLLKGGVDPMAAAASSSRSVSLKQRFHRLFFLDYFPPMFTVWIV